MDKVKKLIIILLLVECLLQSLSLLLYIINTQLYNQSLREKISNNWFFRNKQNEWWIQEGFNVQSHFHPFTGWLTSPKETDHIHVSEEGIRKTIGNPDNHQGLPSIYIFGGSTVWGQNYADDQTIPSYIAKRMNAQTPNVTITNYGQIGFNSSQEVAYLTQLLKQGNVPSLAIFIDGCNDFYTALQTDGTNTVLHENTIRTYVDDIWRLSNDQPPANQSLVNLNAWKSIGQFIKLCYYPKQIISYVSKILRPTSASKERSDQTLSINNLARTYSHNVQIVDALSQKYHFKYLFFFQPLLLTKLHKSQEELAVADTARLEKDSTAYSQLASLLQSQNLPHFYDGTDSFNDIRTSLFTDHCHTANEGNAIIADTLISIIGTTHPIP